MKKSNILLGIILALGLVTASVSACQNKQAESKSTDNKNKTNNTNTSNNSNSNGAANTSTEVKPLEFAGVDIAKTGNDRACSQYVLVVSSGTTAKIGMFEKDSSGNWNTIHATNGYVGKDGVGQASESWSATPAGTYTFTMAFGILPNPGTSLNYLKVNNSHYWVGDVNSSYYNKLVSKDEVPTGWDPEQSEHLIDYSPDYNYSLVFDYNSACVPGEGSCFFFHCSTGRPTAGCVSVPQASMVTILKNIKPGCKLVIM